ncbi:MAG: hypothetical protein K1W21_14960 [Oscillospiraceae bacterium]
MMTFRAILSTLIRNGKVVVETPELDLEGLKRAVESDAQTTLEEIEEVVRGEGMTDTEKVEWIKNRMLY